MTTRATDIWTYAGTGWGSNVDISGYKVEALDGSIGKVDEATYGTPASFIIVDTGPWIFGKKVMLPAGVMERVDAVDEKVYVNRSKDEIKAAPEFDEDSFEDERYRTTLGTHYSRR
jgi:hypothetical protein